jgi:RNA ligase (TIGR02306 family)
MRTLASVQRISDLQPIEGADKIELASVLGWKIVVEKGLYKVGDLAIYMEIDSVLPAVPEFSFLEKHNYRIKTIRLRGQVSQGILFPLHLLDAFTDGYLPEQITEGRDVSGVMKVVKYDPPEVSEGGSGFMTGFTKGNFPSYVAKTDETRIQAVPKLLAELGDTPVYVSVKMDGTSGTFAIRGGEIDICSRNMSKKDEGNCVYWNVAKKYKIPEILKRCDNIVIQGEVVGPGIQKNKLKLSEIDLFVFNIYDVKEGRYYDFVDFLNFCQDNDLKTVPILEINKNLSGFSIENLLELARGKYDSGHNREGIVIRPMQEKYSHVLKGRMSFKVINNDFLLKE